jgi:hypothetical protein
LIWQNTNPQQVTAEHISDGQRLDSLAIGGTKPTFEVHRPNFVAGSGTDQARPPQLGPGWSVAPPPRQLHPPEPLCNGSHRGNLFSRILLEQPSSKFLAAPSVVTPPQPPNTSEPLRRDLLWRMQGATGTIPQSSQTLSSSPFVAYPATDPERVTQLRHASLGLQSQLHELQSPSKRRNIFPRHDRRKRQK